MNKSALNVLYIFSILTCFIGQSALSKTLRIYLGDYDISPYDFSTSVSALGSVYSALFGHLLNSDESQKISPGLIKKWHYDFKLHKYTLNLGNDKFHNGREINADDLEFSIVSGFISTAENFNRIHFSDIAGTEVLKPGMKFQSGMLSGLKVIDNKTVEITLKAANPIFLLNFTFPFVPLIPKEEIKEDYHTWKTYPMGAGPYKIEKDFKDGVLVLNLAQPGDGTLPDEIEYYTQRKNVDYDLIFDLVDATKNEMNFTKVFSKSPTAVTSLFFYRGNRFSKNLNFRKAIFYAIDRDAVAEGAEEFKPAYKMLGDSSGAKSEEKNPYNLKLAKHYFQKLPKSFRDANLFINVYSGKIFSTIMKTRILKISEQLKKVGFNITFEPSSEKFPSAETMKKYVARLQSKVVDLADPVITYGTIASISPHKNEIPDTHGQFDRLYNQAVQASSYDERIIDLQKISSLIDDQALIVPIMRKYVMYRFNPKTVESLGEQSKPLFMDASLIKMK
jgi:ABC-type transport system substrate-binding protein